MSQWKVKAPVLYILGCVVFIMLLIVVLPFIDLPDTAFHSGTAPVVAHARLTNAPAAVTVAAVVLLAAIGRAWRHLPDWETPNLSSEPNFRPILLHSIRR